MPPPSSADAPTRTVMMAPVSDTVTLGTTWVSPVSQSLVTRTLAMLPRTGPAGERWQERSACQRETCGGGAQTVDLLLVDAAYSDMQCISRQCSDECQAGDGSACAQG